MTICFPVWFVCDEYIRRGQVPRAASNAPGFSHRGLCRAVWGYWYAVAVQALAPFLKRLWIDILSLLLSMTVPWRRHLL